MISLTQLELFEIHPDDRMTKLRNWMLNQLCFNPSWYPKVKQIQEIANELKVIDRRVLEAYEEIKKSKRK